LSKFSLDLTISLHSVTSHTPPGHGENELAALFGLCGQRRRRSSTAFFLIPSLPVAGAWGSVSAA